MTKKIIKSFLCFLIYWSGILWLHERLSKKHFVRILMYHKINDDNDLLGLTINPHFFRLQIDHISKRYNIVSLEDALDLIKNRKLKERYFVITFDDGYKDNYEQAFPVLTAYKCPAIIFLTHNAIEDGIFLWEELNKGILAINCNLDLSIHGLGQIYLKTEKDRKNSLFFLHKELKKMDEVKRLAILNDILKKVYTRTEDIPRYMLNWREIEKMFFSGLISFGSHTLTHPILSKVSRNQAWKEIFLSRMSLQKKLHATINLFAYPNGREEDFDSEIVHMVEKSGYTGACTTKHGNNNAGDDLFRLKRINVTLNICTGITGRFSRSIFAVYISGLMDGIIFRS